MNLRPPRSLSGRAAKRLTCAWGLASLLSSACTEPDFIDADALDERNLQGEVAVDAGGALAPLNDAGSPSVAASRPRTKTITRPDGAYEVDVTALGTGCPTDTWSLAFASDATSLALSTYGFEVNVDKRTRLSVKNCQLTLRLRTATPTSFAVRSVRFSSYSFLEEGVKARFEVYHSFSGRPGVQTRAEALGPFDDFAVASYDATQSGLTWSACGTAHDLNMNLTGRMQNSDPPRYGYATISGIDSASHPPTRIVLEQRRCEP